ncbi:indolepyruvate ferredoxin oxidreductase, alpha/beta subunit [Hoeflea sp. IMCC20628]|uniref:indolepyruvate ferredoxin oxidoreductase family protein n=1 Tax=Hoeflea sp. IMCC20628 TaxID=1620421 RepID=UPI00063AD838|nr:indolepyruvate ferredoxin oxidoreductase family protein [Hoeflea sp. IMCC20628]AKI00737.1 indolepyruvate ferredoxin oxidreductase, alpha/beta subunit [Hoeflea sp. IMCC20628]
MLTVPQSHPLSPIEERFTLESGKVHLTGTQALVRVLVDQRRRDIAAGVQTGGFVSGYRGSPLGGLDHQLWRSAKLLEEHNIVFEPGLNEDLAATAVWGSQLTALNADRTVEGVIGLWYGKGPGLDRSMDALKHGNSAGSSRWGGVLAIAGDDHGASSSTLAHQSDHGFIAAQMPVIAPATVAEIYRFGLLGYALSRYSGLWVGMTALTEVVEGSASVDISPGAISLPELDEPGSLHIRWPDPPAAMEARLIGERMQAVARFAGTGVFDQVVCRSDRPWLGIVAPGKAALDVVDALRILGLSLDEAASLGVSIYKPGLVWPLAQPGLRDFSDGHSTLLVIEEKRPVVEDQIARIFYGQTSAPTLIGKHDEQGRNLVPETGVLDTAFLAKLLGERILEQRPDLEKLRNRVASLRTSLSSRPAPAAPERPPYFCAGCPHNTSTKVPDGSKAMAGIGCHGMASWLPDRQIESMTHMGGEGMHWIGQQRFTTEKHRFQNLGDGTYAHSASLNIRAAVAAASNITFKLLYNDAVAMTGGQPVEGGLTPQQMVSQVVAEGVKKVVLVTDDVDRYRDRNGLPPQVEVLDRSEMDRVQRELREIEGVTVLLYEQTCATELRRRRKRGEAKRPDLRVVIDERVCEGCGDCHTQSGCIAIEPLETALGRKRQINQSSCNLDTSCLKGFCPSFVTVSGATGTKKKKVASPSSSNSIELEEPMIKAPTDPYNIMLPGVGGTGIVTISQILAMAAHLEGLSATSLDMAGLAQKNGAVTSHVRISQNEHFAAAKIPAESTDLLIATDLVVAEAPAVRTTLSPARTHIIANSDVMPTLSFVFDGNAGANGGERIDRLRALAFDLRDIPAEGIAVDLFGDGIAKNMIMLGYAWQCGLIPLQRQSIERAIELNGAAVAMNKEAFDAGRRLASPAQGSKPVAKPKALPQLDETAMVEQLTSYQGSQWANRFKKSLEPLRVSESQSGGDGSLTSTAARSLLKLMTYKDEYEVARLHSDGQLDRRLQSMFDGDMNVTYHLAPPFLSRIDPATGRPRKIAFGSWIRPLFSGLAKARFLRGTLLDPFGYAAERREERALISEFETIISDMSKKLASEDLAVVKRVLELPLEIRGFGPVKQEAISKYRSELVRLSASVSNDEAKNLIDG